MKGGVRTILLAGAIIFFIISMVADASAGDWLTLGLIFLTGGLLAETFPFDIGGRSDR